MNNDGMLALPGGIGTLSEVALAWSLMQTGETVERPLVLLGQAWRDTIRAYARVEYIRPRDMDLIYLANSAETATGYIKQRLAARLNH
jgi:predicted Rossmann-fold nucleotide-binding protein